MTFSEQSIHPLSRLNPRKTQRVKQENITLSSNSSTTIATLSGAGMISAIWMTMAAQDKDLRLQVFVDGEIVPSLDVDVATLFLSTFIADSVSGLYWDVQNVHGEGGFVSSQGGMLKFPIPYSNGCVVKVKSVASLSFYSMIDYVPNLYVPYRLKSYNRSYTNNPVQFASTDSLDLFTTPNGSPGWMVFFGYEAAPYGGTGDKYLERNFALYLDGEGSPSHLSSGTEDFFFGSYYWQWKTGSLSSPVASVSYRNTTTSKTAVCVDLLELCNGIYFNSQCRLNIPTEASVDTGHKCGFVAFFYTPVTSAWGQPILSPVAPQSPTNLSATAGNASASVSFVAPTNNGGASITSYTATSSPGNISRTGTSSPINVTGLTNNSAYTFTVTATNSAGTSSPSLASNSVTPVASSVPDAPTGVTASAGNAQATVTFSPGASNGGSAITSFTATSSPGSITRTAASSPITVTGLTNNSAYTFTVHATNANGNSAESSASNSVTPVSGTTYVYDTFTGADTTSGLPSHTPDTNTPGGSWNAISGTWGITSNKAYCTASTSADRIIISGGTNNGVLECDITTGAANTVRGLVFRYDNSSSYLQLALIINGGTNQIELRDSANTLLGLNNTVSLAANTTYTVKITFSGDNIAVFINGISKLTSNDNNNDTFTGNGAGLFISNWGGDDMTGTWDNFKLTS